MNPARKVCVCSRHMLLHTQATSHAASIRSLPISPWHHSLWLKTDWVCANAHGQAAAALPWEEGLTPCERPSTCPQTPQPPQPPLWVRLQSPQGPSPAQTSHCCQGFPVPYRQPFPAKRERTRGEPTGPSEWPLHLFQKTV